MTRKGFVGLVPGDAAEGDVICVFIGVKVPFVLREDEDGYQLLGDCYVHGIMEGEALEMPDSIVQEIILR